MVLWNCKICLLALIGFATATALEQSKLDSLERQFREGIQHYIETGEKSPELEEVLEVLQLPQLFRRSSKGWQDKMVCMTCDVSIGSFIIARRAGASRDIIIGLIQNFCEWLKIESKTVCKGSIELQADSVLYIVDNKKDLTSQRVCSMILQEYGCQDSARIDWSVEIPLWKEHKKPSENSSQPLKILQLTDIHYDPAYEAGSSTACSEPLCCQKGSTGAKPEDQAGHWGDYRDCDLPWHVFADTIDHITGQHKDLDFVYFTGDIINHKIWDTGIDENSKAIVDVLQVLRSAFGETPVYPILGNHESHPVNLFSSDGVHHPKITTQWIFDFAAEHWSSWLPQETIETILKGGYYSTLAKPGLRIVALNSNVCYNLNFWLFYDDEDPFDQLKWLVEVLLKAEEDGELVHILSHIPSGDLGCLLNWSREYVKIVNRFAHVIVAQFNGHTHKDDTTIFFNTSNPSQAINLAFNGGSLTPYTNLNPNYKIYRVDGNTKEVLDFESWTYNITEANLTPKLSPNWYRLYSFKDAYDVENLSPEEIAALTIRIAENPPLSHEYFRNRHREADTAMFDGCNDECQLENLCCMVTYHPEHTAQCEVLKTIFNSARNKHKTK